MADIDKAVELANLQLTDADDIADETGNNLPTCKRCHDEFTLDSDAELCAFCWRCTALAADDLARAVLAMAPTFAAAQVQAERRRKYDAAGHEDYATDRTWNAWLDACEATEAAIRTLDAWAPGCGETAPGWER